MYRQSKWELVIEFMNINKGSVKTRKQLLEWIKAHEYITHTRTYTTIDCYKNYLLKANLIKKVPKYSVDTQFPFGSAEQDGYVRGKFYIPLEGIPENLSVGDVRSMAYGMIGEIIPDDNLPRISEIRDRNLVPMERTTSFGASAFSYSVDDGIWRGFFGKGSPIAKKKKEKSKEDFIKPEEMEL